MRKREELADCVSGQRFFAAKAPGSSDTVRKHEAQAGGASCPHAIAHDRTLFRAATGPWITECSREPTGSQVNNERVRWVAWDLGRP
jgi:hypothetical protein